MGNQSNEPQRREEVRSCCMAGAAAGLCPMASQVHTLEMNERQKSHWHFSSASHTQHCSRCREVSQGQNGFQRNWKPWWDEIPCWPLSCTEHLLKCKKLSAGSKSPSCFPHSGSRPAPGHISISDTSFRSAEEGWTWHRTGNMKCYLKAATAHSITASGHIAPGQLSASAHNSQVPHCNQQASNTYLIAWYSSLCESLITMIFVFAFIQLNRCQTTSCLFCHTTYLSFSWRVAAYFLFQMNFIPGIVLALQTRHWACNTATHQPPTTQCLKPMGFPACVILSASAVRTFSQQLLKSWLDPSFVMH